MKKSTIDNVWIGMIAGVIGAIVGFLLFGVGFAIFNDITLSHFITNVFLGVSDFQSRIVTFSMLIDVILFFVFIKKDYQQFCKGLIAILVLSVLVVAWLY
jgi:hypothetical protein